MSVKKNAAKKAAGKPSSKTTLEIPESPPDDSSSTSSAAPDRKDVLDLATRLVSAQIMASSYHDTATSLLGEIRQMAMDVIESIHDARSLDAATSSNPDLQSGVDLMNHLRMDRRRLRPSKMLEPMSHPDLDRLFQSALRRAYVMLNAPYDPDRVVFAEQIFSPSEILTEGAIRHRFIDFGWPGLKSADPIIKLVKNLTSWFEKHLIDLRSEHQSANEMEAISATDASIPINKRIETEVARLSWLLDQALEDGDLNGVARTSYGEILSALANFTRQNTGLDFGGAFRSLDATQRDNLIFAMFDGRAPQSKSQNEAGPSHDVPEGGTTSGDDRSPRYQPWAIFRYLRRYGRRSEDRLGNDLNRRLAAKRSNLNPNRVPDIAGIEPAEYRFGPLHEEAEDLLDSLEAENDLSHTAMNSDELEVHGLGAEDIRAGGSELDRRDGEPGRDLPKF